MSFRLATAFVEVQTRQANMQRDLEGLRGDMENMGRKSGDSFGNSFRSALKMTGVFMILRTDFRAAMAAVRKSGEAEELQSQFEAVFKEMTADAEEWARNFASTIGRSVLDTKGAMAQFQDTFVPLGFARAEATQLSKQMVQLGTDLSSFKNIPAQEAFDRLVGTLIGNHENARAFGVIISKTTLDMELAAQAAAGLTFESKEQAKVMARLSLLLKGTTDAQGDALRTADSYTNVVRAMDGAFTDLSAQVGDIFTPSLRVLANEMRVVAADMADATEQSKEWGESMASTLEVLIDGFKALGKESKPLWDGMQEQMKKVRAAGFGVVDTALGASKSMARFVGMDNLDKSLGKVRHSVRGLHTDLNHLLAGTTPRAQNMADLFAKMDHQVSGGDPDFFVGFNQMLDEIERQQMALALNKGKPEPTAEDIIGGRVPVVPEFSEPIKVIADVEGISGSFGFKEFFRSIQDQLIEDKKPEEKTAENTDQLVKIGNETVQLNRDILDHIKTLDGNKPNSKD